MNWSDLNGTPVAQSRLSITGPSVPGPGPPPPAFDTWVITEVFPPIREGSRLTLEWTSSAPPGTWYQIYIQGELAWWGTDQFATVTAPLGLIDVQIGAVVDGTQTTDFSGSGYDVLAFDVGSYSGLPVSPITTRALLTWSGFGAGGYHVYAGGAGFDHGGFNLGGFNGSAGTLVGNVVALEGGYSTDGFDQGGFSAGGFDATGGDYSWTSQPLTRGVWNFAVNPYDVSGVEGPGSTISVLINAPPKPPASNAAGKRLTYTYLLGSHTVTLNWLASAG